MANNFSSSINEEISGTINREDENFKYKAGIFLASVTGISALIGFGTAVSSAKKNDPRYFEKGMMGSRQMGDTGANLALRALGWGTLYAFTGCGILFYSIWKLSGANNMNEFKQKIGSVLPKIPKNDPPQGRTEFEGLNDLLSYLSSGSDSKD